ncbi:MAG: metallophosphatase domain-containing protein [Pseudomonadota bacterium]
MRVVCISDTHGGHEALGVLEGDVLIHAGDVEHLFAPDPQALEKVDAWFGRQRFDHVLVTGGNHDLSLEQRVRCGNPQPFQNAIFLQDSGLEIDGVRFYGSPWVPMLDGHAFFADDAALSAAWLKIPFDVDVLITHTPPLSTLDTSSQGLVLGCRHLAPRVQGIAPRLHCFGHVHAAYGSRVVGRTTFANASVVNSSFEVARSPFVFDLTPDGLTPVA